MRTLHLAIKDIRQLLDDRRVFFFTLVMPIAFTAFLGIMLGSEGMSSDTRLAVAWVDQDGTDISAGLAALLREPDTLRLETMTEVAAEEAVRTGKVAAAVVVPRGAGQAVQQGRAARVRLLVTESSSSGSQLAANTLQAALTRLGGSAQAALLSTAESAAWQPFADEADRRTHFRAGLGRALELWTAPALSLRRTTAPAEAGRAPSGFAQSSPGMLVQFTILNLQGAAIGLVLERRSGALRRLLTTPISRGGVIVGKMLAALLVLLVQDLILIGAGQLAFGVDYLANSLATAVMVVSLGFCVAALGLLIGTLLQSESAVGSTTMVLMFVLSGLGGAWFPLEITGPTFSAIGHLLPSAWAMDGFHSILLRGVGTSGVLLPAGVLLAYGIGFLAVAVWRFRFE